MPGRALDLDRLEGFALITETRTLSLPAGESRVRFPGVADGIESPSAILTGLPGGVLEKNRDARVLSPAALVAASLGLRVVLVRTNRRTGRSTRTPGTLRADAEGVIFQSSEGIEALRCSGFRESLQLESTADLAPTPTLSVLARTEQPLAAQVTLSYLAHGFDWEATYTATLAPDGSTMDLGAWVTLANSNGVSFPDSNTAVVAGSLNRAAVAPEPAATSGRILTRCWPRGSTSDISAADLRRPLRRADTQSNTPLTIVEEVVVTGSRIKKKEKEKHVEVEEEQLGDLKLYRVPGHTSVNARQLKQVRLLDREEIPVELLHVAYLEVGEESPPAAAQRVLRTRNDSAHHLGLPLPAGHVDTFVEHEDSALLLQRSAVRDVAANEEFEIEAGAAPDVQVQAVTEKTSVTPFAPKEVLPRLRGVRHLRFAKRDDVMRIEITNAGGAAIVFEARLKIPKDAQLIEAAPAPFMRDGRQVLALSVPARSQAVIRYRTEQLP
jgi:hypothetical protein